MGKFVVITATVFKSISSGPWFQIFRGHFGQKPNVELFIANLHCSKDQSGKLEQPELAVGCQAKVTFVPDLPKAAWKAKVLASVLPPAGLIFWANGTTRAQLGLNFL